jgi:hypothetical protein
MKLIFYPSSIHSIHFISSINVFIILFILFFLKTKMMKTWQKEMQKDFNRYNRRYIQNSHNIWSIITSKDNKKVQYDHEDVRDINPKYIYSFEITPLFRNYSQTRYYPFFLFLDIDELKKSNKYPFFP